MKVAVIGCGHGELDKLYASIKLTETKENIKIDLVIIGGDFQAIRHEEDLATIACPTKYLQLGTFTQYYSGKKKTPYPTLFIGGNHEASHYLWELYHGGFAAPNIYFLGFAGVVCFGGLKIGGLSGIYKQHDYNIGHHERFPYDERDKRSIYHVRKYSVYRLAQIVDKVDIFLSHDWPQGIVHYGDLNGLLRKKPFLRDEIRDNTFGSPASMFLMDRLLPKYWFSAHMHVKFAAIYNKKKTFAGHEENKNLIDQEHKSKEVTENRNANNDNNNPDEIVMSDEDNPGTSIEVEESESANKVANNLDDNPDEILMNDEEESEETELQEASAGSELKSEEKEDNHSAALEIKEKDNNDEDISKTTITDSKNEETLFLALGKCLPGHDFLQILDIPSDGPLQFQYDKEWLSIVKTASPYFSRQQVQADLPCDEVFQRLCKENKVWIDENVKDLTIPTDVIYELVDGANGPFNKQTDEFCKLIGIPNQIDLQ